MRAIALCAILLLGSACDEVFYVGIDPASTPGVLVIDFGRRQDLSGSAKLYRFSLEGRPRDTACWTTFWDIQVVEGSRYAEVDRLEYGSAPDNFTTVIPADELRAGYVYSGTPGYHGVGGSCYFEVTRDSLGGGTVRSLTEQEFQAIVNQGGG